MRPTEVHDGLAVYSLGDGVPVLLMPGPHRHQQPGDGSSQDLIDGLRKLGRRVVSFDAPGVGGSTRPAQLGMEEMLDCADETLAVCDLRSSVDVFGHSMAGLVSLAYALDRPQRVRRLILVGSGSGGDAYMKSPGALWNRTHPSFPALAALGMLHVAVPCRATEILLTRFIRRESYHGEPRSPRQSVTWNDWFRGRYGRGDWHRIARRLDYSPRLGELHMPTLILCGRHDPQYPPAASVQLAAGISKSHLEWFDASGHYPFVEEPNRFWRIVAKFLDGISASFPLERERP